jgi:mannose-6-phosphate isomerase-like protein (cupin superfamily)
MARRRSAWVTSGNGPADLTPWGELAHGLVTAAQTGGAFSASELLTDRHWTRPEYVHHEADECFYVVGGRFQAQVSDRADVVHLDVGTALFVPRGIARSLRPAGGSAGRLLLLRTPGFQPEPGVPCTGIEFIDSRGDLP